MLKWRQKNITFAFCYETAMLCRNFVHTIKPPQLITNKSLVSEPRQCLCFVAWWYVQSAHVRCSELRLRLSHLIQSVQALPKHTRFTVWLWVVSRSFLYLLLLHHCCDKTLSIYKKNHLFGLIPEAKSLGWQQEQRTEISHLEPQVQAERANWNVARS